MDVCKQRVLLKVAPEPKIARSAEAANIIGVVLQVLRKSQDTSIAEALVGLASGQCAARGSSGKAGGLRRWLVHRQIHRQHGQRSYKCQLHAGLQNEGNAEHPRQVQQWQAAGLLRT